MLGGATWSSLSGRSTYRRCCAATPQKWTFGEYATKLEEPQESQDRGD